MLKDWREGMERRYPDARVLMGASMAEWTTFHIGGPADLLFMPRDAEEAVWARKLAAQTQTPLMIMGNGSNLLVKDGGVRGVVMRMAQGMDSFTQEGETLSCGPGLALAAAAQRAAKLGLSGLAPLSGIPASIGGAAAMNAGAYGGEMSQVVLGVEAVDASGARVTLEAGDLDYRYRGSAMMDRGLLVTQVRLGLHAGDPARIREEMADYNFRRREKQPLGEPSAGSFFKRPPGDYAGRLIEAAGLKGYGMGGAQISPLHAGFLINRGGATAKDVLSLMQTVQERVYEMSGIRLEPEVRIVGEDM